MATNCVRQTTLEFNCGYARVAVRELTPRCHGKQSVDKRKRALDFQELYAHCPNFGFPENYFDDNTKNGSLFNRDCDKLLKLWSKHWTPTTSKQQYEEIFSIKNWKALPSNHNHTLARCKSCQAMHYTVQLTFPQGPHFTEAVLTINTANLQDYEKKQGTVRVLSEVNAAFSQAFNTTFTDALVRYGKQGVQKKPTRQDMKKKRREIYRQCRDKNEALKRSTAIAILTEDESV